MSGAQGGPEGGASDVPDQAQKKQLAEQYKNEGNERFQKQHYDEAIALYSKSIETDPTNAVYYANRSISYLRTECFGYALSDASAAIKCNKSYLKGYYRRAAAYMSLGRFKLALKDFEYVAKLCPNDESAKLKYTECNKIVKKMDFERAIAGDKQKSISETLDLESMTIEDKYDGPKLENDKVTLTFVKDLMETYKNQKKLHRKYAYKILVDIKAYFEKQPSLVHITIPPKNKFTVCGDIHGQFYDLMNIFDLNGIPSPENPYLFNGDFVDRGSFSVECIFTLFSFKLLYPDHFFMSRGNHESSLMNKVYGFEGEVKAKYSQVMADLFTEVYNWLPLAHCLNDKVLVMHGGLFSEDNVTLKDIATINRNRQPPVDGIMCELLWSDPQPEKGRAQSKRGCGCQFGPDITEKFLQLNKLQYIIRSHEVKNEGYEVAHDGKCITVFSAPNYCDSMDNKGAFITMTGEDMTPKFTSYEAVSHPDVKPMAYANPLLNMMS